MGLRSLFCSRRIALDTTGGSTASIQDAANPVVAKWATTFVNLVRLADLRRTWSAIGVHLAELKRRGRVIEDGDRSREIGDRTHRPAE